MRKYCVKDCDMNNTFLHFQLFLLSKVNDERLNKVVNRGREWKPTKNSYIRQLITSFGDLLTKTIYIQDGADGKPNKSNKHLNFLVIQKQRTVWRVHFIEIKLWSPIDHSDQSGSRITHD